MEKKRKRRKNAFCAAQSAGFLCDSLGNVRGKVLRNDGWTEMRVNDERFVLNKEVPSREPSVVIDTDYRQTQGEATSQ